eukprot:359072-Chlamydomonas_euryale.AAC.1
MPIPPHAVLEAAHAHALPRQGKRPMPSLLLAGQPCPVDLLPLPGRTINPLLKYSWILQGALARQRLVYQEETTMVAVSFTQAHPFPAHPFPAHPFPAHPFPAHPFPAHPFPAHPFPAHPFPAHRFPAHPFPAHPFPAHPFPAQQSRPPPAGANVHACLAPGVAAGA